MASSSAAGRSASGSSSTTERPPVQRWRLLLAWQGQGYVGWQRQPVGTSIQDVVERAVGAFFGGPPLPVWAAGRLDAGVHARGQVVAVDAPAPRSAEAWVRGLSRCLPRDIACLAAAPCAADFDPRREARGKWYRYRILERRGPCPLRRGFTWHLGRTLDADAMAAAAAGLHGRHDFTSFRAVGCSAASPVRAIHALRVSRAGDELRVDVEGDAFLRHQVRILVGTLVEVGLGARGPAWPAEVVAARDRGAAGPTAPAEGLWLQEVRYEAPWTWAAGAALGPEDGP